MGQYLTGFFSSPTFTQQYIEGRLLGLLSYVLFFDAAGTSTIA
jgi:hypothetical protein